MRETASDYETNRATNFNRSHMYHPTILRIASISFAICAFSASIPGSFHCSRTQSITSTDRC